MTTQYSRCCPTVEDCSAAAPLRGEARDGVAAAQQVCAARVAAAAAARAGWRRFRAELHALWHVLWSAACACLCSGERVLCPALQGSGAVVLYMYDRL